MSRYVLAAVAFILAAPALAQAPGFQLGQTVPLQNALPSPGTLACPDLAVTRLQVVPHPNFPQNRFAQADVTNISTAAFFGTGQRAVLVIEMHTGSGQLVQSERFPLGTISAGAQARSESRIDHTFVNIRARIVTNATECNPANNSQTTTFTM